jgi:nitroreductase
MSELRHNPVDHSVPEEIRLRWSPVSYAPEPLEDGVLQAVFEGARWAASAFNEQPWRFVVARRQDSDRFASMIDCLVEGNQSWARNASVVLIVCAVKSYAHNGKANAHAWFDSGQATAQLMLSAIHQGLHARAMAGIRPEKARETWNIGDEAEPICAVAIGRLADGSLLDPDTAARDQGPRIRKELSEIVYEGAFGESAGFTG